MRLRSRCESVEGAFPDAPKVYQSGHSQEAELVACHRLRCVTHCSEIADAKLRGCCAIYWGEREKQSEASRVCEQTEELDRVLHDLIARKSMLRGANVGDMDDIVLALVLASRGRLWYAICPRGLQRPCGPLNV